MGLLSLIRVGRTEQVLSLVLRQDTCHWILAKASIQQEIRVQTVLMSGRVAPNQLLFNETTQITQVGFKSLLDAVLQDVMVRFPKPRYLVVTVPTMHCFQSELTVPTHFSDAEIDAQIEETLLTLAVDQNENMVFDWAEAVGKRQEGRVRHLLFATVRQEQRDMILDVARQTKMICLGLALDSMACANGYFHACTMGGQPLDSRYLLLGYLSADQVKLSVFVDGALLSESVVKEENEFTLVQAVSALERFVVAWSRGTVDVTATNTVLFLTGPIAT
ncbi:MAG: hypothetical protein R3194_04490, partial [Limnobacter sp.]|nr:hypothetical protein [Limnobacter sp.]